MLRGGENVESSALVSKQVVVIYFATGRGPIGSMPGMLYMRKDSVIVGLREVFLPPIKHNLIEIHSRPLS